MKLKHEVSLSTPTKKTVKVKNSPTKSLKVDIDIHHNNDLQKKEDSSIQEIPDDSVKEKNSSQNLSKDNCNVEFTDSNSSPEKSVCLKSIFSTEDLSLDDEIYEVLCPENYSLQDLCGKNIDLTDCKTLVTCKGEVFHVQFSNFDEKFIVLAVSKNAGGGSLVKLPLMGHIAIDKAVDNCKVEPISDDDDDDDDTCGKGAVKFPDDIKVRHPLLGVDWKAYVDFTADVLSKLSSPKKNKKRKREETEEGDKVELRKVKVEYSETEVSTPKKKKRNLTHNNIKSES